MDLLEIIYYITNREDKLGLKTASIEDCITYITNLEEVGLDIETTSLHPYYAKVLLISVGDKNKTFVIDATTINIEFLSLLSTKRIIGQNLKFDMSVLFVSGIKFNKIYDTLLVEQTIRMGVRGSNGLDAVLERRLDVKSQFPKSIREEFITKGKAYVPKREHIIYSAEDTLYIGDLKKSQKKFLDEYGLNYVMYEIEFPLCVHLVKTELEGIPFNVKEHRKTINNLKKDKLLLEKQLDKEVSILFKDKKDYKYGKYTRERNRTEVIQSSMFNNEVRLENKNKGNINYSSDKQIKEIFKLLKIPIPLKKDKGEYKESTGIEALEIYLKDNPKTIMKDFINIFIKFQSLDKMESSYGQSLINNICEHTNKIHTIYRQCAADTGRFQSGGGRNLKEFINSQQIPARPEFRTVFGGMQDSDKYEYITIDLTGAELVILASLANDFKLKSILDDPHSALGTIAYQAIIDYIFTIHYDNEDRIYSELKKLLKTKERANSTLSTREFVINKKTAKDLRNNFKAVVYGLAYGATADRISDTLNIIKPYAEVIVNALEKEIPDTFNYLKKASIIGKQKGYIIICSKTNNRRWFPDVIEAQRLGESLNYFKAGNIERACKNSPIQGTQAYMVKESAVKIYDYFNKNDIDANILMFIHDELFIRIPRNNRDLAEIIKKIFCDTCTTYLSEGFNMGADYSINDTWVK